MSQPSATTTSGSLNDYKSSDDTLSPQKRVMCNVIGCDESASHSLRRKWILRLKRTILQIIHVNIESNNDNKGMVPICDKHYDCINHLLICSLCKQKLSRNHIFYITQVS